ncbi:hypothetical protein Ahy_B09g095726 isoform C [Arachis hypogaea]|uniref:CCHC-type domain-containing protein n=1 Tax=Arachis hypogaea TaxID=3818 RepID=A0A444XGX0_ARAHY|nr:hypothetical protein Ahy_B09g095726 isoform C [Arachis hypogaea]
MRIKRKDGSGKWYVSRFVEEHNHELAYEKLVDYLRSHRKISEVEQDMYNEVRKQRGLQGGDVNASIRYLEGLARVDGKMFWRYKVGDGKHLCNLFWSNGRCQKDYLLFGDVLAFDATYGRNKYNLPVVVFSGVNHHNQTCVFATAMVSCESHESYIWVLEKFLECMQGKAPHKHCMLADMETDEFEAHWENMVNECGVGDVDWVKDLYSKKYAWTTTYIRGRFFAGIRTTSRCESLHAKLGQCMRMESFGIPCVHIVAVCVRLDLAEIPESLVLRRWSKTAKMEINNKMVDHHTADQSVTYRTRLGAFSQLCKRLGKVACMSDDDFKVYSKKVLSDAVFLEIKYGLRPPNNISTPATDNIVKDPIRVRTKGTGPCSQAGGSAAKTKRKCSTCGKLGHRRTRCPNRDTPTATTNVTATARGHKRKRSKVIYNLNLQSFHIMQLTTLKLMLWC